MTHFHVTRSAAWTSSMALTLRSQAIWPARSEAAHPSSWRRRSKTGWNDCQIRYTLREESDHLFLLGLEDGSTVDAMGDCAAEEALASAVEGGQLDLYGRASCTLSADGDVRKYGKSDAGARHWGEHERTDLGRIAAKRGNVLIDPSGKGK